MIFDAHSDFGIKILRDNQMGKKDTLTGQHYLRLKKSNVKLEVMTIGGDFTLGGIDFRKPEVIYSTIHAVKEEIKRSKDKYILLKDLNSYKELERTNAIGIILGLEGASVFENNSVKVSNLFDEGIRSIVLTDNIGNAFCGGCEYAERGLTKQGMHLIQEIEKYPIMLDLAHSSEKTFYDCMDSFRNRIIVSHGNLKRYSNISGIYQISN